MHTATAPALGTEKRNRLFEEFDSEALVEGNKNLPTACFVRQWPIIIGLWSRAGQARCRQQRLAGKDGGQPCCHEVLRDADG